MSEDADYKPLLLFGVKGRNGNDPPFMLPPTQVMEAMNVDWYQSSLARKRGGSATVAITGGTAFATGIWSLGVFTPGSSPNAAELWAVDGSGLNKRLAGGTSWANVSYDDGISSTQWDWCGLSFNGMMYAAFDSAVNRLHCYDPADSVPRMRRVGIAAATAAPTTSEAGGSVTDNRKYRTAFTRQVSGVTVARSNLSPITGVITLIAEDVTVTRQTAPGESETHWELYAYSDDDSYGVGSKIATIAIATTTSVDNNTSLAAFPKDVPEENANTPPPSAKYIVADDSRIIGVGAWETAAGDSLTPKNNMVWWTSALGASNVGDGERVSNTTDIKGYDFIDEPGTGVSKPTQGSFSVFSFESRWKYTATGNINAPYKKVRVTEGRGCIAHKSIVVAVDETGNPATYWLSANGPVREGVAGEQSLVHDIQDIWSLVNLEANVCGHAIYHKDKHQVWFYVTTSGAPAPNLKLVFDTRFGRPDESGTVRHGWSVHTIPGAVCSVMFSSTLGASMSRLKKPYIGYDGPILLKQDTSDLDDAGTPYQSYLDFPPMAPWGMGRLGGLVEEPTLVAKVGSGVSIRLTLTKDEGAETATTSDVLLTAISGGGAETRVFPQFEGATLASANTLKVRIGDAAAIANTWNLDLLVLPITSHGAR